MARPREIRQFIARLRAAGFVISPADLLRVTELVARVAARDRERTSFKSLLGPLIARSADEQARFGHLYDEFFPPETPTEVDPSRDVLPVKTAELRPDLVIDETPQEPWWKSKWVIAVAVCAFLVLFTHTPVWRPPQKEAPLPPPPPAPIAIATAAAEKVRAQDPGAVQWAFVILSLLVIEMARSITMTLQHWRRRSEGRPYEWPLNDRDRPQALFQNDTFVRAARFLRGREAGEGMRLDLPRSILSTIRSLDDPVLVYRTQDVLPEYLFLIERRHERDHLADYFDAMASALEDLGVIIDRFYFERDPRYCWQTSSAVRVHISDLQQRFPTRRVVVCGDTSSVVDALEGRTAAWVRAHFSWGQRALLTPHVASARGARDWFQVHHATSEGLELLADHWMRPDSELKPSTSDSIRIDEAAIADDLKDRLSRGTFRWLERCATFPVLQWPLTRALAPSLRGEDHETALLQLAALPWFRRGLIPIADRDVLSSWLGNSDSVAAREVTLRLLETTDAPTGSAAAQMIVIQKHAQSAWRARALGEAEMPELRKLRHYPIAQIERDPALIKYLSRVHSPTARLPVSLRRALFRHGLPALGVHSFLWMIVLVPLLLYFGREIAVEPPQVAETVTDTASRVPPVPVDTALTDTVSTIDYSAISSTTSTIASSSTTGPTSTIASSSTTTSPDTSSAADRLYLISPDGGEVFAPGSRVTFRWSVEGSVTLFIQRLGEREEVFRGIGGTSYPWRAPQQVGSFDWWVIVDGVKSVRRRFVVEASQPSGGKTRIDSAEFKYEVECGASVSDTHIETFKLGPGEVIVDVSLSSGRYYGGTLGEASEGEAKLISIKGNAVEFAYGYREMSQARDCPPARMRVEIVVTIAPSPAARRPR